MEDKKTQLILFIAILAMNMEIEAKALPKSKFALPRYDHAKEFIRELSKESPDYEKLGKYVKEFYFEWNGFKKAGKANESPSSYHSNSNATRTNKIFRRHVGIKGKSSILSSRNRRHGEKDAPANTSISFFNIPRISKGFKKKRSPEDQQSNKIQPIMSNMRVVKDSKKSMGSDNETLFSTTELNNETQVNNEQQTVPRVSTEDAGQWNLKTALGIAFILVWIQVMLLLLYHICRNMKYDKYNSLSVSSEIDEPSISQIVNNLSSELSSAEQMESEKMVELSEKPKNKLKTLVFKESDQVKDSQSVDDLNKADDGESPRSCRQKNIQILKSTFSQILSSDPIPQISSVNPFAVKSDKIISISPGQGNDICSKTTLEKDESNKQNSFTSDPTDLEQTYVKELSYDIKDVTRSELQNNSQEFSASISDDEAIATQKNLNAFHILEKPCESIGNVDEQGRSLVCQNGMHKTSERTSENNPEVDGRVLKEKHTSLQDATAKGMTEEDQYFIRSEMKPYEDVVENPFQEQRKRVTFSRVIEAKTFSSKSKCGEIADTFHRVEGSEPWIKSASKSESPSNFPVNRSSFIYPRRTRIEDINDDVKMPSSVLKRLKKKFKK